MASVSLKHIYKIYTGNVTAVSDFTLDIEDKEFVVLVGPSGVSILRLQKEKLLTKLSKTILMPRSMQELKKILV